MSCDHRDPETCQCGNAPALGKYETASMACGRVVFDAELGLIVPGGGPTEAEETRRVFHEAYDFQSHMRDHAATLKKAREVHKAVLNHRATQQDMIWALSNLVAHLEAS